jgi:hypothetical protein
MTEEHLPFWTFVVNVIVAAGTLAVAFVAAFGESIRAWWRRPRLTVACICAPPHCVSVPMRKTDGTATTTAVYLRVLVTNEKGRDSARNVWVYAKELSHQRADSTWEQVKAFPPMNLIWSNHPGMMYFPIIGPDSQRPCDVGHIIDPADLPNFPEESSTRLNLGPDQVSLAFDVVARPNHQGHIVGPGLYRLDIEVGAENARPLSSRLEIDLRRWYPDEARMLSEGVGIRVL